MEQTHETAAKTKLCPHCQKEIPLKAKRCSYCQADLRSWFSRHKILTSIGVVIIVIIVLANIGSQNSSNNVLSSPNGAGNVSTANDTSGSGDSTSADTLMAQNDPTIKVLGTVPTNYIGQTFTMYAYAEAARYYNYGFDDEDNWYSLTLWDNSVDGDFEGVYAYLPKTTANQQLMNQALNGKVFVKITATVPADKWQDGSNAFLQIDSWTVEPNQ